MDYSNKRVSIIRQVLTGLIISLTAVCFFTHGTAHSFVLREKGETYIVDRTGERWNVTQAKSLGFRPERFQYGIGRNAFIPLDDSLL